MYNITTKEAYLVETNPFLSLYLEAKERGAEEVATFFCLAGEDLESVAKWELEVEEAFKSFEEFELSYSK